MKIFRLLNARDFVLHLLLLVLTFAVFGTEAFAQNGPGGISSSLNIWLRADYGTDTTTDNGKVGSWTDNSFTGNDASQSKNGSKPLYQNQAADLINFHPVLRFSNKHLDMASAATIDSGGPYATKSFTTVFKTSADIASDQVLFEEGDTFRGLNQYISGGNVYCGSWNLGADGPDAPWGFWGQSAAISTNTAYILTIVLNGNASATGSVSCYLNGKLIGSNGSIGQLYGHTSTINIGANDTSRIHTGTIAGRGEEFVGDLAEFAYYNQALSSTARNQVESYLALKYGLTLDQTSAQDYTNSAGSVIFHTTTTHASYNNDIAGIGQDDSSNLDQTESRSLSADSIVSMQEAASGMNHNTYLLWGNDNGATSETATGLPSGATNRLTRKWRADATGSVGLVNVSFDVSALTVTGTVASDFALIQDSDADFTAGATTKIAATYSAGIVTFTNVTFSSDQFFGLATSGTFTPPETDPPVLQSYTSPSVDGTYGPGEVINITATYDEPIGGASTSTIVLDNGVSVTLRTVVGSTLRGSYIVGALGSGQDTFDLTVSSITSESVNDLNSNNQSGSSVPLTPNNIGDSSNIVIDTTTPNTTSPGGINTDLDLWYKADIGTGTATDADPVSNWTDQSVSGINATQGTGSSQPSFENESTDLINNNPIVNFDGVDDHFDLADNNIINNAGPYNAKSFTTVFKTGADVTSTRVLFEEGDDDRGLNHYISGGNAYCGSWNVKNDGADSPWGFIGQSAAVLTDSVNVLTTVFSGNSSATGTVSCFLNGKNIGTASSIGRLYRHRGDIGLGAMKDKSYFHTGPATGDGNYYLGAIPEFSYYNQSFSTADRNKIESYSALRWGVTLDQSTAQDYVSSAGVVIYHATTTHVGYQNDIAGIGEDSSSGLNQVSSISSNSDAIVQVTESGGGMDDGEFFLWGNDNAATTETSTGVPAQVLTMLSRKWRADKTGDAGTLTLEFDVSALTVSGTVAADFVLIQDANTDFTMGSTLTVASSYSGGIVTFTNISFVGDNFFGLGTTVDFDPPVLQSFSSSTLNATYGPTDGINITATYDENLDAASSITVVLDNGKSVVLNSISGATASATYTVGATGSTEDSTDLTVDSISAENVIDTHTNARTDSSVPIAPNNIADTSAIAVDTTAPVLAQVTAVPTPGTDGTPNYTFSSDEIGNITYGGGCDSATSATAVGNNAITFDSDGGGTPLTDGTYNCTIGVTDSAGNVSSTLNASAFLIDSTPPVLQSFTSGTASNTYGAAAAINIVANFNEAPAGASSITVTLDNGQSVTLSNIFNSTLWGTFTVGATGSGHDSSDLTVDSITAASVSDALANNNTIYSVPGSPNNIADTKQIVIDVTAPTLAEVTVVPTPTSDQTPNYTFSSDEVGTISLSGGCDSVTTAAASGNNTITLDKDGLGGALAGGTYNCSVTVTDAKNNVSSSLAMTAFEVLSSFSGTVLDGDSNPIVGLTIYGGPLGDVVTDASGNYNFNGVSNGTNYTIAPWDGVHKFTPGSYSGIVSGAVDHNFTGVANGAPSLNFIDDQTGSAGAVSINVPLVASDPDSDPISFSAVVTSGSAALGAYYLDEYLNFKMDPSNTYLENTLGMSEKWIISETEGEYYLILSGGLVYWWDRYGAGNFGTDAYFWFMLDDSYYQDPSKLFDVASPTPHASVSASISGTTLTVTRPINYIGDFQVYVTASDGTLSDSQFFWGSFANDGPSITPIADAAIGPAEGSFNVNIVATDPEGQSVTIGATALSEAGVIYEIDQRYDFFAPGGVYNENSIGQGEKWLTSAATGELFIILPSGELLEWVQGGTFANAVSITVLPTSYHSDPSGLIDVAAPPGGFVPTASASGTTVTVNPNSQLGTFWVSVSASDGTDTNYAYFRVTVANNAPVLSSIADQTMSHDDVTVPVALSATDAESDPLTYTATVLDVVGAAYYLDQENDFALYGSYNYNSIGLGERWILAQTDYSWHIILPDGTFYRWTGNNFATATFVAQLDASYNADPSLLFDVAAPGTSTDASTSISGTTLTVNWSAAYVGTIAIWVSVSDGTLSDGDLFMITVPETPPNNAPVLSDINDQVLNPAVGTFNVAASATDADLDSLTYSALTLDPDELVYELDQFYDFFVTGDYYYNSVGQQEKWFRSNTIISDWFIIIPDGSIYQWVFGANFASAIPISRVAAANYADPSTLVDVPVPSGGAFLPTASVAGSTVTVNSNGFRDEFAVLVSVSDGIESDSTFFHVTIPNTAPVLNSIADQTMNVAENAINVALSSSDPESDAVTYSAVALDIPNLAYLLDQQKDFKLHGSYNYNSVGQGEKWILSQTENLWYLVLADGALYRWDGTNFATASFVAQLDSSYSADPSLLFDVAAPAAFTDVTPSISGSTLTLTRNPVFTGEYTVSVTVSDGVFIDSQLVGVTAN